ncbi:MAG: hypothetical protein GX893_01665 [Firmicutes bacterium]|nr:hypothetical protein [Bacillota bacterium]
MASRKEKNKLHFWGIANAGEGFISIISSTYMSIFLTDVALLPLGMVSAVMLVTSTADFILALTAGAIIVATRPMKWGKLRSWLLVCPPITALFSIIQFLSFPEKPLLSAIIISIGFIIAKATWNLSYTANLSLINVMAQTPKERSDLNAQRMVGSNLGRLTGNYLTPLITATLAATISERTLYPLIMVAVGIFFILANLAHFKMSRSYEAAPSDKLAIDTLSIKEIIITLTTNPQLLVTVLIDLTSNMAGLTMPALAVYYYRYVAEAPLMVSTHMLLTGIAGLCGALSVRLFGKYVKDFKRALCYAYLIIAAALFSIRFIGHNMYAFLASNILMHFLTGTTQPFEIGLYMDNVTYIKWKTGKDANSLIVGLSNIPVKFAGIFRSFLIPFALASAGYVAGAEPTPALKQAIINTFSTIPVLIPLLGYTMLRFAYKLSTEKVEQMKKEIEQRKI